MSEKTAPTETAPVIPHFVHGERREGASGRHGDVYHLSLIHISEPTRREWLSRMPSSA